MPSEKSGESDIRWTRSEPPYPYYYIRVWPLLHSVDFNMGQEAHPMNKRRKVQKHFPSFGMMLTGYLLFAVKFPDELHELFG